MVRPTLHPDSRGKVCALVASYCPPPTLSVVVGVPHAPRGQGSRALVPVGNPVGMRLGSHVSRGRGGGCGFQGPDRSGLARGPCSALGPPRTASSRDPPLGPAEALSARQGPGRELPERVPVLRGAEQEAAGVRGTSGARGLERARGGRGSLHRRHRVSRPGLSSEWQPPPRPWSRPSGDPTPARGCRSRRAHPPPGRTLSSSPVSPFRTSAVSDLPGTGQSRGTPVRDV